jgi:hypothetical protein
MITILAFNSLEILSLAGGMHSLNDAVLQIDMEKGIPYEMLPDSCYCSVARDK